MDPSQAEPDFGAAGGLVTAGLGATALIRSERSLGIDQPRNRLAPFWSGSDPDHLYPSFLFRMLTAHDEALGKSARELLVESWRRQLVDALGAQQAAAAERLLAGEGGLYSETELALRVGLFASVEAAVQSVARDVELANRSLVRLLTTTATTTTTPVAPPSG